MSDSRADRGRSGDALRLAGVVQVWLEALGFDVQAPPPPTGAPGDLLARLERGAIQQRVLVRCLGGEIAPRDVEALAGALTRGIPQGWLLGVGPIAAPVYERAASADGLGVFTLPDFLRQQIWEPYFVMLTARVEREGIARYYRAPAFHARGLEGKPGAALPASFLDTLVDALLTDQDSSAPLVVIGEPGGGKTWFCLHYAWRQLQRFLADPLRERLPLYIPLAGFSEEAAVLPTIYQQLVTAYHLPLVGGSQVVREMHRRGLLLLLLDDFRQGAGGPAQQALEEDPFAELGSGLGKAILCGGPEGWLSAQPFAQIELGVTPA